jgi:hypothetical protein
MKVKYSKGDIVYFIRDRYYEESEEDMWERFERQANCYGDYDDKDDEE